MSIKSKVEKLEPVLKITWSDEEMKEFDLEIEPYRIEVQSNDKSFRYFSIGSEFKYLQDQGILSVNWTIPWSEVHGISQISYKIYESRIRDYEEFNRKLIFYLKWKEQQKLGNFGL